MLNRRNPLLTRLLRAYKLLLGVLLLVIWVSGLSYFFDRERGEIARSLHSMATMLATQSSAALMFGDVQVLKENLVTLESIEGLRWSAVVPVATSVPVPVISHGAVPGDVRGVLDRLGRERQEMGFSDLIVRAPISHGGVERGQLLVAVSLRGEIERFLEVMAVTLLLLGIAFHVGQILFHRIVLSIVAPLGELVQVAGTVARHASTNAPMENLARPATEFADEVGQLAKAFNQMLDAIIRRDSEMREQARKLTELVENLRLLSARMRAVREEERTRISHEIHDELGQRLTALKYAVASQHEDEANAAISAQIDELIRTVRVISWELRPSVLDSLGLVAAMDWQAQDFSRRLGIRCSVDLPEDEIRLPSEMATDLFRVFQELLTNISRHAQATRVNIILEATSEAIFLEVKDDGRGMKEKDQCQQSLGLLGIRERLERWGGIIQIGPVSPDVARPGTHIEIKIPLQFLGTTSYSEQAQ